MPNKPMRRFAIISLAMLMIAGLFLVDSNAQRRRRKRRSSAPRITNPAIYQPSPGDNSNTSNDAANNNENTNAAQPAEGETTKQMKVLSTQVDKLSQKVGQVEESQRSLVDLERLSRAEQRSASLRTDLQNTQAKESDLQAHLEDLDYALKPENIERATAGYGTTHPEDAREQRRRQLETEKERSQKQLEQLAASRARLEQAIATSDAEVERLRQRIDAADAAAIQNAKTNPQVGGTTPTPYATPSPSPYPW